MTRLQSRLLVLSVVAFLQGCTTLRPQALPSVQSPRKAPAVSLTVPVSASPKIVRFADALGAVASSQVSASSDLNKLQAMLNAFDYCGREQRLAFVTPPMVYSRHINYSRVSTYSLRFSEEASSESSAEASRDFSDRSSDEASTLTPFVAPFECIEQKHSVKTGLAESEDVPANALHGVMNDHLGGIIVHRALIDSSFQENDILVSVGSFRVQTRGELAKAVDVSPVGEVSFGVVRGMKLVIVGGSVVDTTASTKTNARQLLAALCKESGNIARSCL